MLDVAEIFASLQGEGPFAGQPATFLRLAGCVPPYCAWCDTPQALGGGSPMTVEEIAASVAGHPGKLVVVTGGEPFRQWGPELKALVREISGSGRIIQYETSGKADIPADHGGFVVCSPKPAGDPMLSPELVSRVDAFKFVVENGIEPILRFVRAHGVAPSKVWLMPLGARREEQLMRMAAVWELCVLHGFNFSPRTHILAFDDRKGI